MNLNNFKKLEGDASSRKFYRNKKNIIIYSTKEKKTNLLIYDAVNKILISNNIPAPKLISHNYKQNFIEIEDFGDRTVYEILSKNKNYKYFYKKIIHLLIQIQKIKTKKTKTFLGSNFHLPNYTEKKLLNEARLFINWYLPNYIRGSKKIILAKQLNKIFINLLKKINFRKKIFVHRDFHVSNIMYFKKKLRIIDSQDAQLGNIAYDLASLIDDVRFKTSAKFKNIIFREYLKKNKKLNKQKFTEDFEILSVLRNFKIIGIFSRLAKRDKKKKYLKLIPHAWDLIKLRIKNNKNFESLKLVLSQNKFI